MNIFITGATGFLGFHVAKKCIEQGYHVLCLKRKKTVFQFFNGQENQLLWVDKDEKYWKDIVKLFKPDVLIHCAWEGVSSNLRNNEYIQHRNLQLFMDLFNLYPYRQVIGLGSQDEYGFLNSVVDEKSPLNPETEYAKKKIECCEKLKYFSCKRGNDWQWVRIFNVYGEGQKEYWIIPSLIRSCMEGEHFFPTTKGEQKYAYLYAHDFAEAITSVIGKENKSGIYNLSSAQPIALKELLLTIKYLMDSNINIDFGAYPYRPNQSMLICGDSNKFIQTFGVFERTSLREGLMNTITSIG